MSRFIQLDLCYPDYFQGHSSNVLAIPVSNETTWKEVIEYLDREYIDFDEYTGYSESEYEEALSNLREERREYLNCVPVAFRDITTEEDGESIFLYLTVERGD